jgi:hypothetical protein
MKGGFVSKNGYTYTYGYIAIRVRAIGLDVHLVYLLQTLD